MTASKPKLPTLQQMTKEQLLVLIDELRRVRPSAIDERCIAWVIWTEAQNRSSRLMEDAMRGMAAARSKEDHIEYMFWSDKWDYARTIGEEGDKYYNAYIHAKDWNGALIP